MPSRSGVIRRANLADRASIGDNRFRTQAQVPKLLKMTQYASSHSRSIVLGWRLLRHSRKAMQQQDHTRPPALSVTRTLRLKVKTESHAWLNVAAFEVNTVWNWTAQVSEKAARSC